MPRKDVARRLLVPVTAVLALVLPATSARALPADTATAGAAATAARPLDHTVWLCKPGMAGNACGQDADGRPGTPDGELVTRYPGGATRLLDDTRIAADGSRERVPFTVTGAPPVDCFYAYPTVDLLANPLLQTGSLPPARQDAHQAVTLTQAARFAGLCRLFVPVYRQVPLTGLLAGILTGTDTDLSTATMDIRDAWDDYWAHDNRDPRTGERRGVVVLGHSQGTATAAAMMAQRVDGDAEVRSRLVSAILLGGNVEVPEGRDSGGGFDPDSTFQHIPACHRGAGEPMPTGCVVSYSSYALPDGSLPVAMGRTARPGHRAVCVNRRRCCAASPPTRGSPSICTCPPGGSSAATRCCPTGTSPSPSADTASPTCPPASPTTRPPSAGSASTPPTPAAAPTGSRSAATSPPFPPPPPPA
ncbi:DUF3089 domain-containing protein [Streptomyces sp. NBC_01429]|uniref:DUF3089 domain-containing protein n=1 Tax=Streptomyces sp. NBC_01429 TaxID=2903862 RepID=UPI002E2DB24A|nr:DUF3089 domain-containing protein [Streptomyces sp. NBC_01429]